MCRVWPCAMGIAAGQVVWAPLCRGDLRLERVARVPCVALCHGDCCWAGRVAAALPWGSASRARRACTVCGAVPWGLLLGRSRGRRSAVGICVSGASRVWRCAMGIAAGQVVWVALLPWGSASRSRRVCGVGGAVPWGSASRVRRVCGVGVAVPWGLLLVAWAALCHVDCCWASRVGGAVPWGLLLGVSRVRRCAMGIAGGCVAWVALCHGDCCWCVAWVALCHWDCCWACRGCGAVPCGLLVGVSRGWRRVLGLLTRASSGWRRVFGIADQGLVAVLVRVAAGVLARPKRPILKGHACTESSFLGFGPGPGVREVENGSFLKAALVQNRHFWAFGTGPGV